MSRRSRRTAAAAAILICLAIAACGGGEGPANEELFAGDGFERALEAVRADAGEDASLLRVQVTARGAEFYLVGEEPRGLIYAGGELDEAELGVVPGGGALSEQAFPLSEVDPAALGRLVDGAREQSGEELDPVAITLERSPVDGSLRWTLNAAAGIAFSAGQDGSDPTPAADARQQGL